MQTIMLATDFSERSDRALRRAVLLAREHGAAVDLVHVVDNDRPRRIVDHEAADARALLNDLAASLESMDGLSCRTQVRLANPFAGLAKAVDDASPDLLVIGPHRRQALRDTFIGTTAERTIRTVSCPVLMVNGPPAGPYHHVLLTTDLSDNAQTSLQHFETMKIGTDSRVSALYVFDAKALRLVMSGAMPTDDQKDYLDKQRAEARRGLARFMTAVGNRRAEQIVQHEDMPVAAEILNTAGELGTDLIVVSTRGKNIAARMILGSTSEQVLRSASVDVLAIPPTTGR
jgi:nucleotide-binding universal stress UspA family protein